MQTLNTTEIQTLVNDFVSDENEISLEELYDAVWDHGATETKDIQLKIISDGLLEIGA